MVTKKINLRRCIEDLSAKTTDYKFPDQAINQAESLKSLSSDLYTDNIRFIYELIQNADDALAKNVILTTLEEKYFIITHDGKPFDEKDLQGLCGVNNGTKKKDPNQTGYKGLGFKAVFGKSNKVLIYSDGEYFRFDSSHKIKWKKQWGTNDQQTWEKENDRQFVHPWQINPIWTVQNKVPSSIKDFLDSKSAEIHVANIILLKNIEEIRFAINQLKQQSHMFLFLRNLSRLTFTNQTTDVIFIDRNSKKVYFNEEIISQWIIKRYELNVPDDVRDKLAKDTKAPEKLRCIQQAEMFFAAKYTDEGVLEKLQDKESYLFSYLPTKISEYIFPVLINANFLTNVNREQIHTDSAWNQWLFERIGIQLFEWIKELVMNDQFHSQVYRLIPTKLNLTNNILSKQFDEAFDRSIQHCKFIRNRKNELVIAKEAIMDLTSMSIQTSFIDIDKVHSFIDYDGNLSRLGVRHFTWQNCIEMFQSNEFIRKHSIEKNKQMIQYFHRNYSTINTDIHIEQIPFLLDQNNRLESIKEIYFPREPTDHSEMNLSFLHEKINQWLNENKQKDIKEWLEKLGIKEPTNSAYFIETIIRNTTTFITPEDNIKKLRNLFVLFRKNLVDKKELSSIKQLKLLTTRGTLKPAEQCFFSNQFDPRLRLEEYLKDKEDRFLSFQYISNENITEWRRFFVLLGVQEELSVIKFQEKINISEAIKYGFNDQYLTKDFHQYYNIQSYCGLITITFLEYTKDNYQFAKLFWSHVTQYIKIEKLQQSIRIYWGHSHQPGATNGTIINYPNYIQWFVTNIKCLPTTLNTCEIPRKIFRDTKEMKELCGEYMPFPSIPLLQDQSDWYDVLSFKTKLSINDYLNLLEKIRYDQTNLHKNLNRIQMIYSSILKDIQSDFQCENVVIKSRKDHLYFLSENNQWKLAYQLYLYVDSNETNHFLNDIVPCLKLDFNNRNHQNLPKFIEVFGIRQITKNNLILKHENSSPAKDFQNKLIEISSYLKNWLKILSFSPDVISLIDKIIQQDIDFIESDCLQLFYNEQCLHETNVYNDIVQQKFYLTRPWNSEITFTDLPTHICRLLQIQGFEDKLRFLFRAEREEICKHFTKHAIEKPTDEDIVIFKPLAKADYSNESIPTVSPLVNSKLQYCMSIHHVDHGWVECSGRGLDDGDFQMIDLSDFESLRPLYNSIEGNDDLQKRLIGELGEEMVYHYLEKKYSSQSKLISVQWENQNGESHLPYDILLNKNRKRHYIEVKSTRTNDEKSFQLSINQIEAILQYRQYYHIYRVSTESKKLTIFNNVQQCLQKQRLHCFFAINSQSSNER